MSVCKDFGGKGLRVFNPTAPSYRNTTVSLYIKGLSVTNDVSMSSM